MVKVEKDKVVSVTYELRVDNPDGEIIESLNSDSPLTFLFGSGSLLPKFESNISGMKIGDKFDFHLPCEDAYGTVNENAVIDLPKNVFEVNGQVDEGMLQIGNTIPMQDNSGNKLNGVIMEVSPEKVTMDFNHPLAGNHLFFTGEITEIRDATEDELHHGHAHTAHSCEGCSDCGGTGGHC